MATNLTSDEALTAATGRSRAAWFDALDAWDAAARSHRDIAAWLMSEHGMANWWAQTVAVEYERARGLRPVGGGRDGLFAVSGSKTIAVSADRLFAAVADEKVRGGWLPDTELRRRPTTAEFVARFDEPADGSRVVFSVLDKGAGRSALAIMHERLSSAEASEAAKAFWRDRLTALKSLLES